METVAESVARTNRVLCVEEGWPSYGVTAEIAARVQHACFDDLDAPVERVGMAEVPMPYAKNLENATLPGEERSSPRRSRRSTWGRGSSYSPVATGRSGSEDHADQEPGYSTAS